VKLRIIKLCMLPNSSDARYRDVAVGIFGGKLHHLEAHTGGVTGVICACVI